MDLLRIDGDSSLQVLWEDGERVVCRGWRLEPDGNRSAVLVVLPSAEHPTPATLERLAHECRLQDELDAAWAVRPLGLCQERGRTMLMLADPGGELLETLLGQPMPLGLFLRVARGVAEAVARLHRRGLIHKDLKPANIMVDLASGAVRLTGFGIASRLPRERQSPAPPEVIAGTLAYMAPEQTGRMNRSIDARSDLYALGVTCYQMLTGSLPFTASDPMEWVHCHIARKPLPPAERLAGIPEPVSALIMKLLAKTAEERYQTASGLGRDLRRCLSDWEARGRIDTFPLGEHDTPDHLLIPEKLYGRAREVETLLAAFDRVVASGAPELVLVSGYSGIGKSAVVLELHKALVPPRGLFASGKFDQYKRDIPYATLVQAFQSLVRPLLGKSNAELATWRDALLEALGPNGRLMTDLIPDLKLVIGDQPPVPDLEPKQAQRRFQLIFCRFIGVFAQPDHPLALFLDDLQWLDAATLDLLEDLLTRSDLRHLMLIGAYRDNEVDAAHPLTRKLDAIRKAGAQVLEIRLAPLACDDLMQLIADALRGEVERVAPLAQLVFENTAGNPFFVIQFLYSLAEEGLLRFDRDAACWSWDLAGIHAMGYTDNVVDLMVGKLSRLPVETQQTLQQLACLGNVAAIAMLSIVLGIPEEQVHAALWEAMRQELVERQNDAYRFIHDRVHEAAYSLIPEASREADHLRIGRLLVAHTPPAQREEAIFEIVNQFNRGASLITAQDEREQLAELNLIAGLRAKGSTAYASALTYLTAGAALLAEDCWERRHELIFALELNRAECEFLTGALEKAEQHLVALSGRAADTVEHATVTCLRIDLYMTLARGGRAIEVGLDYLLHLGIALSPHPTEDEARREYERIWSQLAGRTIEELVDLPLMTDPVSLATMDVLTKLASAAFFVDLNLHSLIPCRAINLSLERGHSDGSCFAYELVGLVAGARFGDYQAAYRFGRLGCDLVEQRGLKRFEARTYENFGVFVLPWTKHFKAARDPLHRAFDVANKVGDLIFAGYSCANLNSNLLAAGDPLVEVQRETEHGLAFVQKMRSGLVTAIISTQLGLVRNLRGLTQKFGSFDDAQFDELHLEHRFASNADLQLAECFYWIRKLQARFFAGDYASSIEALSKAQRLLWTSLTSLETSDLHFYGALSRAASYASALPDQRQQTLEGLAAHHRQLQLWAEHCPENFESPAELVGAEIARVEGRVLDAEHLYERAIQSAQANGFVHNEALACELAARFYAARGFEKIARGYLQDARYGYLRWGAEGKVRQLDQRHPELRPEEPTPAPTSTIGTRLEHLDLATVIKASCAVSGEIVLDRLIETLMTIALEHAGAERGLLLLLRDGAPQIKAEAKTTGAAIEVTLKPMPVVPSALPETVLHTVIRTQHSVILDNATTQYPFAADAYIRQTQARSVLCLPLVKQTGLIGALYLENRLTSHMFTPARIAVLELLASQAAISLENARLYTDLLQENRERQAAEDAMQVSEARWRSLFENVAVGIALVGSDGRLVEVNQAFCKMTGYSAAELRHLTPGDITHEDDRAATAGILSSQAAGLSSALRIEKRYRRKDGGTLWGSTNVVMLPVIGGEQLLAAAVVTDITERKRAEAALRRSEAYLTEGQRLSHSGSFGWHVSRGDIFWSAEAFNIFGYDQAASADIDMVLKRVHPDDLAFTQRVIAEASRSGRDLDFEHRLLMPDGAVKYVHVVGHAVRDQADELEFIGSVIDVTTAKRAEEELHKAQANLTHAARIMTLGELAASIAHEINQPLATIATNASAGLRWLAREPPDVEEARACLRHTLRESHRAGDVIARIRSLIRKAPPVKTSLDLNDAIREVLSLIAPEAHRHAVLVQAELDRRLPPVRGDRVQLQQVILNLAMNGIDAMKDVAGRPRELRIRSHAHEAGTVLVAVADTGIGLAADSLARVFEAFYTTKAEGMGMGLSISRSIIVAHGGQLWPSANDEHGATFQFTLPTEDTYDRDTAEVGTASGLAA